MFTHIRCAPTFSRRAGLLAALLFLLLTASAAVVLAAPGDLDPTFGTGGIATLDLQSGDDFVSAVAIQSDGKIVVAGEHESDFLVARYTTSGALDGGFGAGGIVVTHFPDGLGTSANALVIQLDGKIVAAGRGFSQAGTIPALARYHADGSLDSSFGNGGRVTLVQIAGSIQDLALRPDGKLLALVDNYSRWIIARFNSDGSLDHTFGTNGVATILLPTAGVAGALKEQPDGKIVAAGRWGIPAADTGILLARLNSNGAPDPTFGNGGQVVTDLPEPAEAKALLVQSDGKLVVAGHAEPNFLIARYTSTGALDPTFGTNGITRTSFGGGLGGGATALIRQHDGKFVVLGDWSLKFALARYTPEGQLDSSFGNGGLVTTALGVYSIGTGLALQADGKLVAAGYFLDAPPPADFDGAVARYENDDLPTPNAVGVSTLEAGATRPNRRAALAVGATLVSLVALAVRRIRQARAKQRPSHVQNQQRKPA